MINLENSLPGPNYETGDELHVDALLGKHFGEHFALGIAGYWYTRSTDDKGPIPPPLEPGYKSEGAGFGPVFMFGSKNFSVVAKWLYDPDADNRLNGDLYMLSFVARFGGEPPPPPMPGCSAGCARRATAATTAAASGGCRWRWCAGSRRICVPRRRAANGADVNGCSCDFTVQVHFKSNSTEITGADAITLDSLADQVRRLPTLSGELGGHTDSQGSEAFNVDLSRRRALAVVTIWRRVASTSRSSRWLATANHSRSRTTPRSKVDSRTVAWS